MDKDRLLASPDDGTPAYLAAHGSFRIARPVSTVWPLLLEYTSWQAYTSADPVSGKPGEPGEVVLLKKEEPGLENFPAYFARTIKVAPLHQVVWKTWPAEHGVDGFTGIVDFRVEDHEGDTQFSYNVYYEFHLTEKTSDELRVFEAALAQDFQKLFDSAFTKLRNLAERGSIALAS